jgi:hypothetical protein
VNFASWRGDEHIVDIIAQCIIWANQAQPIRYLKQLVAGHRGCGKSTELLLLKDRLEREGYFVVYFDSALEVDMNDVDYADILLATMRQLEWQVRHSPLGLKLDGGRLDDLAMRLARVTIEKEDRNEVENAFRLLLQRRKNNAACRRQSHTCIGSPIRSFGQGRRLATIGQSPS